MPINQNWIQNGIEEAAIKWASDFGYQLTRKSDDRNPLTTSQIRKFYGELKRIQANPQKFWQDIPLLKAKLAYAVGRSASKKDGRVVYASKIRNFYDEVSVAFDFIRKDNVQDFINFVKLVEAVVAYHKFYGGDDK